MRITLLGTGTSSGVPALGCHCEVCRSDDPRDKRMRSVAMLESGTTRMLIDCGPDIRMQLMPLPFEPFDAVLLTHIHYDHVGGIDDLRALCVFGDINIYADGNTVKGLKTTMPYCFTPHLYPGVPKLNLHTVKPHEPFRVGEIDVMPITVMHDKLPILGYRFGKLAYITDMKTMEEGEFSYLEGVETLVVNALRWEKEHHSHMLIDDAIKFARTVGAKRTYLTHLAHTAGLHAASANRLPVDISFGYDGLVIDV